MLAGVFAACASAPAEDRARATAEERAVAYLAVEVPKWAKENACYSCHNNGDAARALVAAWAAGDLKSRKPLDDTLKFLATPQSWDENGPEGPFKDKKLARIQFAAALVDASRARAIVDRGPLELAAALVSELQTADGSWETDAPGTVGSPVTYGRPLATAMAVRVLQSADRAKYRAAIAAACNWFETTEAKSVLDAASTLWALAGIEGSAAKHKRGECVRLIRRGESSDGGWGPFLNSPSEVFDTALVVLALAVEQEQSELSTMIARGRKYLIATQAADGSWPATTRPHGVDSYAQQLSTTGWSTLALLATRGHEKKK